MCNQHKMRASVFEIADLFGSRLATPLGFPEGAPNLEPRDEIKITDMGAIVRPGSETGPETGPGLELVQRRWSWPGPTGAPVFNFRAEGRRFPLAARCAIPTNGFYEFTANADAKIKRKDRWLFTMPGEPLFFIAGILRADAWSMLTVDPGPDIAPFHNRQVVVLRPEDAGAWLRGGPEAALLRPSP
ncbi:MAG: SOS response-associated peptidase family protein, partial [Caulobacteraceae bacterium]